MTDNKNFRYLLKKTNKTKKLKKLTQTQIVRTGYIERYALPLTQRLF